MLKNLIKSAALGVALLAAFPQAATAGVSPAQQYREVGVQGDQTEVVGDWTASGENPDGQPNPVQESELTRKALQAEKARNAAENDKFGGAITIIAMSIVLSALIILSLLFLCFGSISSYFQKVAKRRAHGVEGDSVEEHHEENDSGEAIAAIAMALAEHFGQGHDIEDTKLTIKRLRKAYSPWNSKIYNLRQVPAMPTHHMSKP